MIRFSLALTLLALLSACESSAPPRLITGSQPQVNPDRTVTFRLVAPAAHTVSVNGDFRASGEIQMTQDNQGIWTATIGPLRPDMYGYNFTVDGVGVVDSNNTLPKVGVIWFGSQFLVPGPESDFLTLRNVPHGEVHEIWYYSQQLSSPCRVIVYTPPGYEATSDTTYPVLYLLHGHGDDETGWTNSGRANLIMDNLIADGKAKPALIVMPFGSTSRQMLIDTANRPQPTTRTAADIRAAHVEMAAIQAELLDNIIPLIEKNYHVKKDRAFRAIAGLSMGGNQTLTIGLNHLDQFSYVAAFSAGIFNGTSDFDGIFKDPQATNQQLKLLYIGVGDKDTRLAGPNQRFEQALAKNGVNHQWVLSPGYAHQWTLWRIDLRDVLQQLFQ